jgi:hypothetical protein
MGLDAMDGCMDGLKLFSRYGARRYEKSGAARIIVNAMKKDKQRALTALPKQTAAQ